MKRTYIIFCILTIFAAASGHAQAPQLSIFESFESRPKTGEGYVIVNQSNAIKRLVGTRIDSENAEVYNGKTYIKTQGYRIQVYSGNNQLVSKKETEDLKEKITELYPGIDTNTDFDAPWWTLYVGNYPTYEEAFTMSRELQKAFPQRKKEISIFETTIRLPMD